MNIDLKKITPNFILILGFFSFILLAWNNNLIYALIYLTSTIIFWVLYRLALDIFDIDIFARIISFSGLLVAISILCIFGIEEVPYPIGAFIFHAEGFAGALGIGLFSIFPIIMIYQIDRSDKINKELEENSNSSSNNLKSEIEYHDWEIATEDDLFSDEFEIF